jgi:hypothetical protein
VARAIGDRLAHILPALAGGLRADVGRTKSRGSLGMNPERSAYGMAMIANDIGDAMDLLVSRASKTPRETRAAEKAAGHKSSGH